MAKSKKAKTIKVDFSEATGGRPRYPEGDYHVKITKVDPGTAGDDDKPVLNFTFEIQEGKYKGRNVSARVFLTAKAAWRLKNLLEAAGVTVPAKVVDLPYTKLVGKELGITLTDDEYNNRKYSDVTDFLDLETLASGGVDEDEDEEEEDEEDEDEDEEEEEEEELEEVDLDDL